MASDLEEAPAPQQSDHAQTERGEWQPHTFVTGRDMYISIHELTQDHPTETQVEPRQDQPHTLVPGCAMNASLNEQIPDSETAPAASEGLFEQWQLPDLDLAADTNKDLMSTDTAAASVSPEPPPRSPKRFFPTVFGHPAEQQPTHADTPDGRPQDSMNSLHSRYSQLRQLLREKSGGVGNAEARGSGATDMSSRSAIPRPLIVPQRVADIEAATSRAGKPCSGDVGGCRDEERAMTPEPLRAKKKRKDSVPFEAPPSSASKAIKATNGSELSGACLSTTSERAVEATDVSVLLESPPSSAIWAKEHDDHLAIVEVPPSPATISIKSSSRKRAKRACGIGSTAGQPEPDKALLTVEEPDRKRDSSIVSRGRRRIRRASRSIASATFTAGDLLVPPNASIQNMNARIEMIARALGQSGHASGGRMTRDVETADHEAKSQRNGSPPPDGGAFAWAVAVAGFFVAFNTWGLATSFGAFMAYYRIVLLPEESLARIAWIGSTQLFLMFFLGTPIGLALDRGWFRVFFNGGTALLLGGVFITSSCTEWWQVYLAQGIMTGVGQGMVFCSGVITLMSYFSSNMAKAMAFGVTGASCGAIVYPGVFKSLIDEWGFAWTVRMIGFLAVGTMVFPTAVMRRRRGHEAGLRMEVTMEAWRDKAFLVMAAGMFFAFWGMYFASTYMVVYSTEKMGQAGSTAIDVLIVMSAGNLVGRVVPGVVSDACTGPLNLVIPSSVLAAFMTLLWIATDSFGSLIGVACFYGFFSAGIQALYTPALHGFGHDRPSTMGQKSGLVFTVISVASLTGTPIGGLLIAAGNGSYVGGQVFAGTSLLVGAGLLLWSRWLKVGWQAARV